MSTATADSIYRVLADCNRTVSPFSDHHEPFTVEIPNCRAFDRPGTTEVIHDVTAMGFSGVFALPGLWRDVGRLPGCTRWEAAGRPGHQRDVRQARHPRRRRKGCRQRFPLENDHRTAAAPSGTDPAVLGEAAPAIRRPARRGRATRGSATFALTLSRNVHRRVGGVRVIGGGDGDGRRRSTGPRKSHRGC